MKGTALVPCCGGIPKAVKAVVFLTAIDLIVNLSELLSPPAVALLFIVGSNFIFNLNVSTTFSKNNCEAGLLGKKCQYTLTLHTPNLLLNC